MLFQGPCKGDSGGPLYVDHGGDDGRQRRTVEGIVFGGLTCGGNVPSWYTRVRCTYFSFGKLSPLIIVWHFPGLCVPVVDPVHHQAGEKREIPGRGGEEVINKKDAGNRRFLILSLSILQMQVACGQIRAEEPPGLNHHFFETVFIVPSFVSSRRFSRVSKYYITIHTQG